MKFLLVLGLMFLSLRASAVDLTAFAEGRQSTGDASAFPNVTGYTDGTAQTFSGGLLASFQGSHLFFRTGAIYVPRTYMTTDNNKVDLSYTMNSVDVPAWLGLKFGFLGIYVGADLGLKLSSSSSGFANGVTFQDESTFISPQAGIDLNFSRVRISAFYEAQTKVSTATIGGQTAPIRGTSIGARFGVMF